MVTRGTPALRPPALDSRHSVSETQPGLGAAWARYSRVGPGPFRATKTNGGMGDGAEKIR